MCTHLITIKGQNVHMTHFVFKSTLGKWNNFLQFIQHFLSIFMGIFPKKSIFHEGTYFNLMIYTRQGKFWKTLTELYNGWPKLATNSHYISISKLFSVSFDQDHIDPLPESSIEFCILFDSDLIQKKFRDTDLDNSYHCIVWLNSI